MAKEKFDIKKSLKSLEEIISKIESGELSFTENITLYQKGKELINKIEKAIDEAELEVETVEEVTK